MIVLRIYQVTITKAYSCWEQGVSYTLFPKDDNTSYYESVVVPTGRVLVLAERVRLCESEFGIVVGANAISDHIGAEMAPHDGSYAVDHRLGVVRDEIPGEVITPWREAVNWLAERKEA